MEKLVIHRECVCPVSQAKQRKHDHDNSGDEHKPLSRESLKLGCVWSSGIEIHTHRIRRGRVYLGVSCIRCERMRALNALRPSRRVERLLLVSPYSNEGSDGRLTMLRMRS